MRLLLDTHALLWWWLDSAALSPMAKEAIANDDHEVCVSAATGWEIATKARKGHLPGLDHRAADVERHVLAEGFRPLPITMAHGVRSGALSGVHKDPFDRMLAAQALMEDLTLVTCDRMMADFGCKVLW